MGINDVEALRCLNQICPDAGLYVKEIPGEIFCDQASRDTQRAIYYLLNRSIIKGNYEIGTQNEAEEPSFYFHVNDGKLTTLRQIADDLENRIPTLLKSIDLVNQAFPDSFGAKFVFDGHSLVTHETFDQYSRNNKIWRELEVRDALQNIDSEYSNGQWSRVIWSVDPDKLKAYLASRTSQPVLQIARPADERTEAQPGNQ